MCRIIRVPAVLDKFFCPLRSHFHWHHWMYCRLLVVAMVLMWGRRNVANLYCYLLRIARHGAQGQRTHYKAAEVSTATAQDQLRRSLWEDLVTYQQEKCHGQSVIEELERLRVA
jgi:hypothetical protein